MLAEAGLRRGSAEYFEGILGFLGPYLVLQLVLRVMSLVMYLRRERE